ncbi:MAG: amidohydrolase family protein [Chloroflexota bacterium]|nr:MAG: amidohydrolase family protein [Chloroflexota bacterium]
MTTSRTLIDIGALLDPRTGVAAEGYSLLARDGSIEAVLGPGDPRPGPGSVGRIDLAGLTALPGLIDAHAHLIGKLEFAGMPSINETAESELAAGEANALATLRAGVTTVRDVGTYRAFLDVELRGRISTGLAVGPRMQCAAAMITRPYGGGEITGIPDVEIPPELRLGVVRDPVEMAATVERLVAGGADVIKLIVTGAVLTRGSRIDDVELEAPMIEAAVARARDLGVFVAAHAHGTRGIRVAAESGVRSVEHASLIDDAGIEAMIANGTWMVADVYDGDWIAEVGAREGWPAETLAKNAATTEAQRSGFSRALAAGVRMAFGTDSGVYPHAYVARQFPIMVRLGMSPLEVIRAATVDAAEMMGWSDRIGSLEAGHYADLIAVAGDPRREITSLADPVVVIKGGEIVRDDRS